MSGMKLCPKCQQADRNARGECNVCRRARIRAWKEKNPDKVKEQNLRKYERNKAKHKAYMAARYVANPEHVRRIARESYARNREDRRAAQYGLPKGSYEEMLQRQGGVCAICGTPPRKSNLKATALDIDHDHATGRVRGLLCGNCNTSLGKLGDTAEGVRRFCEAALVYLSEGNRL